MPATEGRRLRTLVRGPAAGRRSGPPDAGQPEPSRLWVHALPPFTVVRLSPASPAGLAYAVAAGDAPSPLVTTDPLDGTWLLPGTGTALAIGRTRPPNVVPLRLDVQGAIDRSADATRLATAPKPGQVVLTGTDQGPLCRNRAAATAVGNYSITTRVDTDSCGRLGTEAC